MPPYVKLSNIALNLCVCVCVCERVPYNTTQLTLQWRRKINITFLPQTSKTIPLEHLLEDKEFPDISYLDSIALDKDFSHIAESKGEMETS